MSMKKIVCSNSQLGQFSSIYETINTNPENRDLVLVCGGVKLSYHQAIVFQHSTFLSSLAKNSPNLNEVVVTLDSVNPVVLRILMDCIYSGKCDKVPGEVLFEVEKVHQMLGFNIYFNAETLNADDGGSGVEKKNPEVTTKPQADNYLPPATDESQNLDSSVVVKSEAQLSCIYCKSATSFGSPSVFLQHLSSKHFRKQLTEKYGMSEFVPYQPCVCCQKLQKNAAAYLIHVGASHKKVVEFLPEDLKQVINGSEKNRKVDKSSQMEPASGSMNTENESIEMNLKGIKELLVGKGEESGERDHREEITEGQFEHHSSYLKQEIPENYYGGNDPDGFAPIDALDFKEEAFSENFLPNGSLNRTVSPNETMDPNALRLPNGSMLHNGPMRPNGSLNASMPPTGPLYSNEYMPPNEYMPQNGHMPPTGSMPQNGHMPPNGPMSQNGPMPPNIPMYLNGPMPSNGPMFPNGPIPSTGPMFPNGPMPPQGPIPQTGPMLPNGSFMPPAIPNKFFEGQELPGTEYSPTVAPQGNFNLKQEKLPPTRDSMNENINSSMDTPSSSSSSSSDGNSSSSGTSSESGMRCTSCKDSKVFESRSRLLQHGAMNHFRKFLVKKYLPTFVPGQKCDDCGKEQKTSTCYLMHIGARHEKVLEFFPDEMLNMIKNYRKKSSKLKKRKGVKGKLNHLEKKANKKADKKRKIKKDRLVKVEKSSSVDAPVHGIRCTICQSDKVFPSKSSFMQHLSVKHFRRSITEKYLANFKPGHPCDKCQKPQKNAQTFMIHIGAFHKKVLGFLSDEMNRSIESMESSKNRKSKS